MARHRHLFFTDDWTGGPFLSLCLVVAELCGWKRSNWSLKNEQLRRVCVPFMPSTLPGFKTAAGGFMFVVDKHRCHDRNVGASPQWLVCLFFSPNSRGVSFGICLSGLAVCHLFFLLPDCSTPCLLYNPSLLIFPFKIVICFHKIFAVQSRWLQPRNWHDTRSIKNCLLMIPFRFEETK